MIDTPSIFCHTAPVSVKKKVGRFSVPGSRLKGPNLEPVNLGKTYLPGF